MPPNATAAGPTATPVSNTPPTPTTTAAATAAVGIGSSVGQIPTRLPTTPIQMKTQFTLKILPPQSIKHELPLH